MTAGSRDHGRDLVLSQKCSYRVVRLTPLHRTKMTPQEGDDGDSLEPTARHPLVDIAPLWTGDPAHASNRSLKVDKKRGDPGVVTGLRNTHLEAQITRPRFVRMHHRAALAVEEAGGPGEFRAIEDHNGRRLGHAKTPFPVVAER